MLKLIRNILVVHNQQKHLSIPIAGCKGKLVRE